MVEELIVLDEEPEMVTQDSEKMILELDTEIESLPINYYEVKSFVTISKTVKWWSVIALLRDPKHDTLALAIYKFQQKKGEWKRTSSVRINEPAHAVVLSEALFVLYEEWATQLDASGV